MSHEKTIGITLGDQAGIGPEVISAALTDHRLKQWVPDTINIKCIGEKIDVELGKPNLTSAQASLDSLNESIQLANTGEIDAIVTAPVAKEWLHRVGFDYPGQTEFYADNLQCDDFAMCLSGKNLTVALVTIHVPITSVPGLLRKEEIIRVGKLLASFCKIRKGRRPRIAVCGLNPHAGENGAFGDEDIRIITPAINQLNDIYDQATPISNEPIFSGPHPPDTIFRPAADGDYDAVLCMYHDQGLIPLKLLDFDTGVNTTLGLRIPRTSPDHGTAFDIAGTGKAEHESMLYAIKLAAELIS